MKNFREINYSDYNEFIKDIVRAKKVVHYFVLSELEHLLVRDFQIGMNM